MLFYFILPVFQIIYKKSNLSIYPDLPLPGCSHRWVWRVSSGTCPCCHTSSQSLQSRNRGPNDQLINDNDDNNNDYLPDHQRCPRPACWSCSSHWAWLWAWAQRGSYIVCLDFTIKLASRGVPHCRSHYPLILLN